MLLKNTIDLSLVKKLHFVTILAFYSSSMKKPLALDS